MFDYIKWFNVLEDGRIVESPLNIITHNITDKVLVILRGYACDRDSKWVKAAVLKAMSEWITPLSVHPPGHFWDIENFSPSLYRYRIFNAIEKILETVIGETDIVSILAHSSWAYWTLSSLPHEKVRSLSLAAPALIIPNIWNYRSSLIAFVKAYSRWNRVTGVDPKKIIELFQEEEGLGNREERWKWYIEAYFYKLLVLHNPRDSIVPWEDTETLFRESCDIKRFWHWLKESEVGMKWTRFHTFFPSDVEKLSYPDMFFDKKPELILPSST